MIIQCQRSSIVQAEFKQPMIVLTPRLCDVLGQTAQADDLIYGFPVALLITRPVPGGFVTNDFAVVALERHALGLVVVAHAAGRDIKQGLAGDDRAHDQVFNGKEKPGVETGFFIQQDVLWGRIRPT